MNIVVDSFNNLLEVHKGKSNRRYYLSRNVLCRTEKLKLSDFFGLKKKITSIIGQFSDDKNMLFHYKLFLGTRRYLIIYCIKQQLEDAEMQAHGDVMPVQFLINKKYGKGTERRKLLCIVYKIRSVIYLVYSIRKCIVYCRIIDDEAADGIKEIIAGDVDMINNDLQDNFTFSVVSNVDSLKDAPFVSRYLKEGKNALSV